MTCCRHSRMLGTWFNRPTLRSSFSGSKSCASRLGKTALRTMCSVPGAWVSPNADGRSRRGSQRPLNCSAEAAQPRIDAIALDLWRSSTLPSMYRVLIERILDACESPQVTLRTKAMRAVSHVIAQDPSLFQQDFVRRGIDSRMLDASPAVRDASVELVGKYVVSNPALAIQYLPKICDRVADSGLSVRRRVVKLLKILFGVVDDETTRVDICRKLVCRVLDEDDGIKVRQPSCFAAWPSRMN